VDDPIPRPVREAGGMLLDSLLALATEREDVRRALTTVNAWLARELSRRAEEARGDAARGDGERTELVRPSMGREVPRPEAPRIQAARAEAQRTDPARAESGHGVLVPRGPQAPPLEESRPVDLERVHLRASWKAAALRLALDRRRAGAAPGPDLRQRESELRSRQAAVGGPWAWMLDAPPARVDDASLDSLATSYEAVAKIAAGLQRLEAAEALEPAPPVELLRLVAECQSALLVALAAVGLRQDDDQRDLFQWLRERTTRHRIYVDRHMRLEDPADPKAVPELMRRFEELEAQADEAGQGRRQRGQLLNKVRYHVRKLLDGGSRSDAEWGSLGGALQRWRASGFELSERPLTEVLGALAGVDLPSTVRAGTHDAAQDALILALGHANAGEATRADALDEVRRLVGERRALMVAERDDEVARAELEKSLGLAHLDWLGVGPVPADDASGSAPDFGDESAESSGTAEGTGIEPATKRAAEPDGGLGSERIARVLERLEGKPFDLVFMGLRLPQDEYLAFKERCVALQLPFVRLPGAPSAGAVAHQTMRQVGWRLREPRSSSK
jgi:hypothetical protein